MSDLFLTTHWTRVLAARGDTPEARQALSDLCADYYNPVLTFIRQSRHDEDAARDLAHEFFASLLEQHGLKGVDPRRGRFRTYLLGAVKHFLAKRHASASRQKRGGGVGHESIGLGSEPWPGLEIADESALPPDVMFDREWALNVLNRALNLLAHECQTHGTLAQFEALKPWLTGAPENLPQSQMARQLGLTDGAIRVAIHRLRHRFRELVKGEIAQTVNGPTEVAEELQHLITVLS